MSSENPELQFIPTAAELFAAASVIEERCVDQNIAFLECKTKCEHPKECLAEAHSVQDCVMDTFTVIRKKCPVEFNAFSACLDKYNTRLEQCRKTQKKFLACWNAEPATAEKKE